MTDGDGKAADRLRAESRPSTLPASKRARHFLLNLVATGFSGPASWPPVDIVVVDGSTGRVLKTWHEGGEEAVVMLSVLDKDLAEMTVAGFVEKWDVPL